MTSTMKLMSDMHRTRVPALRKRTVKSALEQLS